ncbi:chaperonin 10-like protein [Jimgerdemannia flammicorona]|uniref:Chaperonin 10-like protein n=1 Tax=Jimgerdemannia flammicorona TaxID=994334 RepID=A0A433DBN9_9FUNG|nr:chaperonin 10-like protein [Jimgerdemannia flammicorona]
MATMKAVLVKQPGDASQLYIGETDKPVPQDDQILVKVKYFCLNRMDISQRHGRYPPPPGASQILGVEVSGIVEEAGKNVKDFKVGDKVFGLMGGGGYASYAVINHYLAMHIPDTLTFQQAAAIPEMLDEYLPVTLASCTGLVHGLPSPALRRRPPRGPGRADSCGSVRCRGGGDPVGQTGKGVCLAIV